MWAYDLVAEGFGPGANGPLVLAVDFADDQAVVDDLAAVGALCRDRGVLLAVDAIQSLGVLPIDVKRMGIHFLAAGARESQQPVN